jgi:hypothetical protein
MFLSARKNDRLEKGDSTMRESVQKATEGNLHVMFVDRFSIAGRHFVAAHVEDASGHDVTEKITEKAFGYPMMSIEQEEQIQSLLRMARHHGRRVEVKEL